MERIPYKDVLPQSFFRIPPDVYRDQPFRPEEEERVVSSLFREEAERNDIVLYTDHQSTRLVGIFPHDSTEAFFGFWETMPGEEVNREAFTLLEKEAVQRGRTTLAGPLNFNTFHAYRLRLGAAPSWTQFDREPVNPAYYPELLEGLGYAPASTFESRLLRAGDIPAAYTQKKELLAGVERLPFTFIPLHEANWRQWEEEIFTLVKAIFSQNPLFRSISPEQFRLLYNPAFARKLCPYSSVLFQDPQTGHLAAMSFCMPNYRSLASVTGFKEDYPRLQRKTLLVKTVGVHPGYRQQGLMNYLGAYAMRSFRQHYEEVIFCLMRTGNYSLQFSEGLPYEAARYALYAKTLV